MLKTISDLSTSISWASPVLVTWSEKQGNKHVARSWPASQMESWNTRGEGCSPLGTRVSGECVCAGELSYTPGFYPAFLIPRRGYHPRCLLPTPFAALAETALSFHVSTDESRWILPSFFQICCFLGLEGEGVCGAFTLDVKCTELWEDVRVKITNSKMKFCQKIKINEQNLWWTKLQNWKKKKDPRELC